MAVAGIIYVAYHNINGKAYINIYNTDGEFVKTLTIDWIDDWSFYAMCIDSIGNVFFLGYDTTEAEYKLYKIDSSGNIIESIISTGGETFTYCDIAIGKDGYIYTSDEGANRLNKRNPNTLEVLSYAETNNKDYDGLAFYSNTGYIVGNYTDGAIEKWDFVDGYIEKRNISQLLITNLDLAISGEILLGFRGGKDAWTSTLDLNEDATTWAIDGIPRMYAVGVLNNEDFIFAGEVVNNGVQLMARYTPAKVLVWLKEILPVDNYIIEIKAYPFPVAYDYPLYPVIFPLQT